MPRHALAMRRVTGTKMRFGRQGKAKSLQETTPVASRGILTRINPEGLKALRQLALDRDTLTTREAASA